MCSIGTLDILRHHDLLCSKLEAPGVVAPGAEATHATA